MAVDDPQHLLVLAQAAVAAGTTIPALVDVDVSYRTLGLHIGVRRSPLRAPQEIVALAQRISDTCGLSFAGVLAYEAHIAGLTDRNPFSAAVNGAKYALKRAARGPLEKQREAIANALSAKGLAAPLFNGGGSGSLPWASHEPWLSEVTAGSAFLTGHLFDYYRDIKFTPALFFALQVVRIPGPGFYTCHGGGYVASGEAGKDRLPIPAMPTGLKLLGVEGAGEVQTPLAGMAGLRIGDPVFFRHAKAGEWEVVANLENLINSQNQNTANNQTNLQLQNPQGKEFKEIPLGSTSFFEVYKKHQLTISKGDLLQLQRQTTVLDKDGGQHKTTNGAIYQIKSISPKTSNITLSNDWIIPSDFGNLKSAYYSTSHAAQGQTVNHSIFYTSNQSLPLLNQEMVYVANSRFKLTNTILTPDLQEFKVQAQRGEVKSMALQVILPKELAKPEPIALGPKLAIDQSLSKKPKIKR